MSESREVVILANPFSGTGVNQQRVESLADLLAERGMQTRQVWDLAERGELLAQPDVGQRYRCVVSAGGDGSMAGVVNDLQAGGDTARATIAMLPLGNENLFAQEFGHDKAPHLLADAIDQMNTRTIDVGEANGHIFTLMASAGFDAEVVRQLDTWRRATQDKKLKRVNRLSYVPRIGSVIAGYRYPLVTLTADGQSVTGAHAFVFNIGRYGGGLRIGSHADASDGLLDWIVFKRPGRIRLGGYGLSILLGRHLRRGDVVHGRSEKIVLNSETDAIPLQTDGDPSGTTPATITVRKNAMRVLLA